MTAPTMLHSVTVVDTRAGAVTPDRDVILRAGLVAEIAPAAEAPAFDRDGIVVDAAGRYLLPGFIDMHGHPLPDPNPADALQLMLTNGITGFRQMSGSAKLLRQRRKAPSVSARTHPRCSPCPARCSPH